MCGVVLGCVGGRRRGAGRQCFRQPCWSQCMLASKSLCVPRLVFPCVSLFVASSSRWVVACPIPRTMENADDGKCPTRRSIRALIANVPSSDGAKKWEDAIEERSPFNFKPHVDCIDHSLRKRRCSSLSHRSHDTSVTSMQRQKEIGRWGES